MAGVCTDVPPLVVSMDGEVETHQLREGGVLIPQHGSEVGGPVLGRVDATNLEREREREAVLTASLAILVPL